MVVARGVVNLKASVDICLLFVSSFFSSLINAKFQPKKKVLLQQFDEKKAETDSGYYEEHDLIHDNAAELFGKHFTAFICVLLNFYAFLNFIIKH